MAEGWLIMVDEGWWESGRAGEEEMEEDGRTRRE